MLLKLLGDHKWASEEFAKDLKKIFSCNENQIKKLAEWFHTSPKISGLANEDIIKASRLTGINPNVLMDLIHVLRYILYHWHKNKISFEELIEDFTSFIDDEKKIEKLKKLFITLEKNKEKVFKQVSRRSYLNYSIPIYQDLSAVCDLRAVFEETPYISTLAVSHDYKNMIDIIPVIIVEVLTSDEEDIKRTLTFQLSEESLGKLQDGLGKIHSQLLEVKQRYLKKK